MVVALRHRSPAGAKRVHCAWNSCLVTAVCVALLVSISLPAKRAFAEEKAPPPPVPPIELKPSKQAEFKNCSDAAMGCEAAGSADAKSFEDFKTKFKKKPKKEGKVEAQICDIVVYNESAGAPTHSATVVAANGTILTIGQNGDPKRDPPYGNTTLNDINTFQNDTKNRETNWEIYTPADNRPLPDSIKDAQKEAAKDPKASTQAAKDNWLKLWRECHTRNVAVMSGKQSFRPPALQPLGPTPSPLRPPEGSYASVFLFGVEGVANSISLGMLEKDATNGVATNGFGESSRAGGGGFLVGANTRIFSRMVLPDDASPRPVERVLLSFDFFNQDTSHVFPTTPQTFIGATSKFMVTGEVQLGVNVVPGVQIYGIGGFSVLNQDLNINFGGGLVTTQNNTTIGPTYGAGLSFQIPGSPVTSFVQWEQTPFATTTLPRPPASSNFNYDFTNTSNRVKAGILVNLGGFSS
jgi:opacity protein-like surface antigen